VLDFDHWLLWSWAGEVLLAREVGLFGPEAHEAKELMETCIRSALAGSFPPVRSREEWEEQRRREEMTEFHMRQLRLHLSLVLAYLSFPLLEAVVKKTAHKYVELTGKVLKDFEAPNRDGTTRLYRAGSRCSNVNHLLFLLHKRIADSDLKDSLDQVRQYLVAFTPNTDPFDLIADWRNTSLHGEATLPTIGGTILTFTLLIALNGIRTEYARYRAQVWDRVCWEIESFRALGHRSPWSFYPPW
jgi:hypothetical protein